MVVGGLRVSEIVVLPGWFFTSGLLPDNTGIQQEMDNWGGTINHYSSLYITKVNPTSRSTCDFQT